MWSTVCWRDREGSTHLNEWAPLGHPDKENREACSSPLLPVRPFTGRPGGERNRKKSMMKTHSGEENESFWIFTLRTLAPEGLNFDG